ncbi:DUF2161 domain-containing phosphodiesterase [Algicella marina]|uniref:DUF2161 domain-containing phosphodiesterase n=1 Tax=Algicella marina TaxID=2683284 RepID=A0A6P1SXM6_9RHOB|nr:DUF2161 family putative PD-(D/E)XK-type phosphodiesterase [Algicella marina]QHQ34231.1 hypothetical protein GO499_03005 [Algicella marina]
MRETDLYAPVKAYLEGQGFEVKGEIGNCDVLARRGQEPPVVVELKLTFSLALVMQGTARQALFDDVYLAVPVSGAKGWKLRYKDVLRLCRRLGLGLLAVDVKTGRVTAHLDPGPYQPRRNGKRAGRLLREFERRVGDPVTGGVTGVKQVTAYRQSALRAAEFLAASGPARARDVAAATGFAQAGAMLRADHYGWFERVERGVYALTPKGVEGLAEYAEEVAALAAD